MTKRKIAFIEPFYTGSHKSFADELKEYSNHQIDLYTLPGVHWKWRMHGAAITLANEVIDSKTQYDLIMCTSLLDLGQFKGLVSPLFPNTKFIYYFHENQFAYPSSPKAIDEPPERELHYQFINIASAVQADLILFNSQFNADSFLTGASRLLSKMPDHALCDELEKIKQKVQIMPVGIKDDCLLTGKKRNNIVPHLLWNHRFEHDKNPDEFFEVLRKLKNENFSFKLIFLGAKSNTHEKRYLEIKKEFEVELIYFGYAKTREEYIKYLHLADILLVTSFHDFFGVSIVEAILAKCQVLLPRRQVYPERGESTLYSSTKDAIQKIKQFTKYDQDDVCFCHQSFLWSNLSTKYDTIFGDFYKT